MPWTPFPISRQAPALPLRHALILGALHGPAELLPISSSGHLDAIPWLLGWGDGGEPAVRKVFDVALHTGATVAWLLAPGSDGKQAAADLKRFIRPPGFLALAVALPAAAGLMLEEPIERRLGTPATIAVGLAAGSLAMLVADRSALTRSLGEANASDGVWLGLAQASALFPGVSRSGATTAAARLRGWNRRDSHRLSSLVGLPVIAGATALKGLRLVQQPPRPPERTALALGAGASFGSTWLLASRLSRWAGESPTPYAIYRLALALGILARLRTRPQPARR